MCGEEIGGAEVVYCQLCATPHHKDCWLYLGWCSTYGCGSTLATGDLSSCGGSQEGFSSSDGDYPIVIGDESSRPGPLGGPQKNPYEGIFDYGMPQGTLPVEPLGSGKFSSVSEQVFDKDHTSSIRTKIQGPVESGFSLEVYNMIDAVPGSWVHPSYYPLLDTNGDPLKVIVGVCLFPLWIVFYISAMVLIVPMAIVLVMFRNIADIVLELLGYSFRFGAVQGRRGNSGRRISPYAGKWAPGHGSPFGFSNMRLPQKKIRGLSAKRGAGFASDFALEMDGPVLLKGLKVTDASFVDFHRGIAFVHGEDCYRFTEDSGYSWKRLPLPFRATNYRLASCSGNGKTVLWVFSPEGKIAVTVDGGVSWEMRLNEFDEIVDCSFISPLEGFMLCRYRGGKKKRTVLSIYQTSDGGYKWTPVKGPDGQDVYIPGHPLSLCFIDASIGWIGEMNGRILVTENGGKTWKHDSGHLKSSIVSVAFTSAGLGIASGSDGNVWVRNKNEWCEAQSPASSLPSWHVRSLREVSGNRLCASCSRGLMFLKW